MPGVLPAPGSPAGVRALDLWSNGRYGSVLFWVDRKLELSSFDHAVLLHHNARRPQEGRWRSTGSGGLGMDTYEPEQILADQPPGLHRLGGARQIRCA